MGEEKKSLYIFEDLQVHIRARGMVYAKYFPRVILSAYTKTIFQKRFSLFTNTIKFIYTFLFGIVTITVEYIAGQRC
jgi:hypothetical protein